MINPKTKKEDGRFTYVPEYKICEQCGLEIIRKPREGKRDWNNRKFCSSSCYHKASVGKKPFKMTQVIKKKIGEKTRMAMNRQEVRDKISGENGSNWKGGITKDPYPQDWNDMLRDSIRQRDNYMCQECGIHQDELDGFHKRLSVHHIDYNKDNLNPNNLITLCVKCHTKTNYNREYWKEYFKQNYGK